MNDIFFMQLALEQAALAAEKGEVPVGAVICKDGQVLACAHNRRELDRNALAHAELLAIDTACKALGGWRLQDCDLYVTLEPCPMCTGAIINARIRRIVFGASDPKAGCCGSITDLPSMPFNHHPEIVSGVCAEECASLLRDFFAKLRKKRTIVLDEFNLL